MCILNLPSVFYCSQQLGFRTSHFQSGPYIHASPGPLVTFHSWLEMCLSRRRKDVCWNDHGWWASHLTPKLGKHKLGLVMISPPGYTLYTSTFTRTYDMYAKKSVPYLTISSVPPFSFYPSVSKISLPGVVASNGGEAGRRRLQVNGRFFDAERSASCKCFPISSIGWYQALMRRSRAVTTQVRWLLYQDLMILWWILIRFMREDANKTGECQSSWSFLFLEFSFFLVTLWLKGSNVWSRLTAWR